MPACEEIAARQWGATAIAEPETRLGAGAREGESRGVIRVGTDIIQPHDGCAPLADGALGKRAESGGSERPQNFIRTVAAGDFTEYSTGPFDDKAGAQSEPA